MTDGTPALSRGQFLRNTAKGSLVLATAGGVLASAEGVAFAKGRGHGRLTRSDIQILQIGFIAETLAVTVYSTIVKNFSSFKGLQNKDYFTHALRNEQDHREAWGKALGAHKPTGFSVHIPAAAVSSTHALLKTGVTLETAFVSTYLAAVEKFSSVDLKEAAAAVASNEATHFSFFDAAFGGHAVLPSFPKPLAPTEAAAILKQDGFIS